MKTLQCTAPLIAGLLVTLSHAAAPAEASSLEGTAWILQSLGGRAFAGGVTATLRFEAGRANGTDGCNRYTAPVTIQGTNITIGPHGATTKMACLPDIMKQSDAFMAALSSAARYRVSGGMLELLSGDGAVLAKFDPQLQSLAGSSWSATGINNGREAVVSVLEGTSVTMNFGKDDRVSGSAGCNNYTSTYREHGGTLTFTAPAATRRMCVIPGVMEQEKFFFKALESVATMRIEANDLELRSSDGALALSFRRSAER